MKLRLAFWPILVVMGIPGMTALYWEPGDQSYPTREACEARLPALEMTARKDKDFLVYLRELNGGEPPSVFLSHECIDKPPREYELELRKQTEPAERSLT
jgi:hypothetical protein